VGFDIWALFETLIRITDTLHEFLCALMIVYRLIIFYNVEMFQIEFVEKIKKHTVCSITFLFRKIVPFMRQCGKSGRSRRAKDGDKALEQCMLDI